MIVVDQNKCVGCRACFDSCPIGAVDFITITNDDTILPVAIIDPAVCGVCGVCIDRCPVNAIAIKDDKENNESKLVS
ncbi:MAG: 4Fe-4S binding protein [Planctomycetaceae bacterium]|jgi:energy-converting hydrogenase A subunit P|nr:4Fe-4S binding protein [Planctomycetaceae bacterium]